MVPPTTTAETAERTRPLMVQRGRGRVGCRTSVVSAVVAVSIAGLSMAGVPLENRLWDRIDTGQWEDGGNWEPQGVPDNTSEIEFTVDLGSGGGPDKTVTLSTFKDVNALTVGGGRYLTILGGGTLGMAKETLQNGGVIRLLPGDDSVQANLSVQSSAAGLTLNGTGRIELLGDTARIIGTGGPVLVQTLTHSITGFGLVGINDIGITNAGRIDADVPGETLVIDPAPSLPVNNAGTLRATNGGVLRLAGGLYSQTQTGRIEAFGTGRIEIDNAAEILGGNLFAQGGGEIHVVGDATLADNFAPLEIKAPVFIADQADPLIAGELENDNTITQLGASSTTAVQLKDDTLLTGGGQWVLADTPGGVNQIGGLAGHTLTNGPSHTIRGAGRVGVATLVIENEGTIHADGAHALELFPGNQQAVTNTGLLHASGTGGLTLARGSHFNSGELRVDAGSTVLLKNQAQFTNAPEGIVTGGGTVVLENGAAWSNQGAISPGQSAGVLTVQGGLLSNGGELIIELGGTTPGTEHDQLVVTGDANVGQSLRVSLIDGFIPTLGDTFEVMSVEGTRSGTFAAVAGNNFGNDLAVRVLYEPQGVTLEVVALIPGDYNGSGQVEQGDLDLVLGNWGNDTDANGLPIEWTHDSLGIGQIEQSELDRVLGNWGSTAAPHVRGVNVPDPAAGLVFVALAGLMPRRRA